MCKMTNVQLGVVLLAICLSTQVVHWTAMAATTTNNNKNSTDMTGGGNSTYNATTTTATDIFGSPSNSTSPTGAGVSLHTGTFSFLIPFIVAAALLQSYC
ncbi:uncharacterized protein LOC115774691 isoform X2 [Archocentrus centrarchus]|uniref:uncharacterized protein LOC115774691 isoform X2 n=1 Tax=Archocentrus centrarchus TaxID=63155 RepID=UPI0011E9E039|nr:uncharacterized protein LOC115774691 isoform X2 [Archocentrus centrarchus]